ncbi:Septin 4 [Mortierella claussenii]|nr:Septin 4 [Mortierella claussenii]
MTGTLPLEIASSLRLVLVGDTGVGKTKSRTLFLNTVPGQVHHSKEYSPSTPDMAALSVQENNNDEGAEGQDTVHGADGTNKAAVAPINGHAQTDKDGFLERDSVSTLEIPNWLLVSSNDTDTSANNNHNDNRMVPAENIVLHDFVGYGQTLDAQQTIQRVDAFLTDQYVATLNLFSHSVTPLSTMTRPGPPSTGAAAPQPPPPEPFLEQLLVDSPMAHTLPDACLYFVLFDLKPVDIVFMKRIMHHVNLIPILAKADTLSKNQLWKAKVRILRQLQEHEIEFFRFGYTLEDLREMAEEKMKGGPPFALSTAELETQLLRGDQDERDGVPPVASLTDLANSINEGKFAESHSDLPLLQALLLGSKNRMLHQASVRKFMNRWKTDLGLPLEQTPPIATAAVTTVADVNELSSAKDKEQEAVHEHEQEQVQENEKEQQQQQQQEQDQEEQTAQPLATHLVHEQHQQQQPPVQEEVQKQEVSSQPPQPIPAPQQQQQPQQPYSPQQQQQHYLPPALQQQTYQPTSSYTSYSKSPNASSPNLIGSAKSPSSFSSPSPSNASPPGASGAVQDEEVAQVIKLNRAQSVIRAASPSAKIYTQGGIVPAVPVPPPSLAHTHSTTTLNAGLPSSASSPTFSSALSE